MGLASSTRLGRAKTPTWAMPPQRAPMRMHIDIREVEHSFLAPMSPTPLGNPLNRRAFLCTRRTDLLLLTATFAHARCQRRWQRQAAGCGWRPRCRARAAATKGHAYGNGNVPVPRILSAKPSLLDDDCRTPTTGKIGIRPNAENMPWMPQVALDGTPCREIVRPSCKTGFV